MSRTWTPELGVQPGETVRFDAVIAASSDSFNRLVNARAVVGDVPAVSRTAP